MPIDYDESGNPILLATRAPGQVAAQPDPSGVVIMRGAASGNPKADPVTGRFAGGKTGRGVAQQGGDVVVTQATRTLPQGVSQQQWDKRMDIVRTAARTLEQINPTTAKNFLATHSNVDEEAVDITSFVNDAKAAKIDDLTDILAQQVIDTKVKVNAPAPFVRSAFAGLSDDEVKSVLQRLTGRGLDEEDVKNVVKKISNKERKEQLETLFADSQQEVELPDDTEPEPEPEPEVDMADQIERIISKMPPPVVNVTVEPPKPTRRVVNRDDQGLITDIQEVAVDG